MIMTEKKNNLNFNAIISLSLLLCSNYYFSRDRGFRFDHSLIKEDYFVLFLFLTFFFLFFEKFSNLFQKSNYKIHILLIYFFNTWILVQILKGFFLLANYISLPILIKKIFSWSQFYNSELYYILFIFFIPYIICFLIVFFYKKNILRFFIIVGYVFFLTVIFREFKELSSFSNDRATEVKFDYEIEGKNITDKNRKVLWILFDEFDYEIAFNKNDKSSEFMKNFKKLKKNSFFHSQMFATANTTMLSMPHQFIGIKGFGNIFIDNTFFIISDLKNEKRIEFNFQNTIFGRLKKIDFTSSIFSSGLPYCNYIAGSEKLTDCKDSLSSKTKRKSHFFLDGVLFVFPIINKFERFFELIKNKKTTDEIETVKQIKVIKELKSKKELKSIKNIDGLQIVFYDDIINSLKKNTNLTFVHTWVPHIGTEDEQKYIQEIFDFKTSTKMASMPTYILNLKYVDLVLNKIMNILKNYEDQEILLILSSDHWFREARNTDNADAYSVLFFAKILNDKTSAKSSKKTSTIYIQELIYKYLTKEISNHAQIKEFLEKKDDTFNYIIK